MTDQKLDGPGLTMCHDGLCPNYRTCFRAQAEPGPNQWFYAVSPREGDQCRLYAPMLCTDGTSALKEQPVTLAQLAMLREAARKANSAYDAARKAYKRQQKSQK